jgi:hypothetical protein
VTDADFDRATAASGAAQNAAQSVTVMDSQGDVTEVADLGITDDYDLLRYLTVLQVAEAGVEHSTKSSGKSRVGRQVVQKAVQGLPDLADIVRAVARLTPKQRAALLATIDAAKAADPKGAKP